MTREELDYLLEIQKEFFRQGNTLPYKWRKKKLLELKANIKKYEKELKLLQKTRNTMEHCICCSTDEQLLALFETAVPFINDFLEEELNESAEQLFNNWDSFLEIEELAKAREKNVGWRIDYFIVSNTLKDKILDAKIHTEVLGSDHCPIELDIDF